MPVKPSDPLPPIPSDPLPPIPPDPLPVDPPLSSPLSPPAPGPSDPPADAKAAGGDPLTDPHAKDMPPGVTFQAGRWKWFDGTAYDGDPKHRPASG